MEKKTSSGIILTLLLLGMLALTFNIQPVKSDWAWTETIYIRADGSVEPDTAPISTVDYVTYTLTDNIVGDVPYGTCAIAVERDNIVVDGADYTVQSTESGTGIDLSYRTNVTVKNVDVSNFGNYGVYLYQSSNNTLTSNNVLNNYCGIRVESSSNNNITGNNVSANSNVGLHIYYDSNYNVITGNKVSRSMAGIQLQISSNNILTGNIISDNYDGIRVESSSNNNVITANIVSSNQDRGISLHYSRENTFVANTISENLHGIYIFYFSSDNTFFHNNLLDNTFQAYGEWNANTWDDSYPSGGNYWSDYVDVDERSGPNRDEPGNDGTWDHPYVVNLANEDKYPLVNPWVPRIVGVQVGDWVKYSVEIVGYRPGFPVDLNDVEWGKTIVQAISGTTIEAELLWHLKNGTEVTTIGTVDVVTSGYPGPSSMAVLFVSKGLPIGATLYATYPFGAVPPSLKINETITREYLGVSRETNHIEATEHGTHINAYWDKATGILSEFNEDYEGYFTWSLRFEIVDTNLWKAPSPTETTQQLIEIVRTVGLPKGTANSLTSKLEDTLHLLDIGNENGAIHKLREFISQVEALEDKKLNSEQADHLVSEVQRIIALIDG